MARLVIGTSKAKTVPAIKTPFPYVNYTYYEISPSGVLQAGGAVFDFGSFKDVAAYVLKEAFQNIQTLTTVEFTILEDISGRGACENAFAGSSATSVSAPVLADISGYYAARNMFSGCTHLTSFSVPSLKNISGNYAAENFLQNTTALTGTLDFSSLERITGSYALSTALKGSYASGLNFSSLKSITGNRAMNYCCQGNARLTSVDFSSLEVAGSYALYGAFESCSNLTSVAIQSLVTIGTYGLVGFANRCPNLTSVSFDSLKYMQQSEALYYGFVDSTGLRNVYFPALIETTFGSSYRDQFGMLLSSVSGCTLHFPSNLDPQSGSTALSVLGGYPTFSGSNTVLLFDLPATNHLIGADSMEYERNPKYDTQTTLAWRVLDTGTVSAPVIDWTPFYTSGTTDPTVGTTIYSDAACTTSVTTVTAIA